MLERATTLAGPGALGHRYRGNEQNVTASETDETESTESSDPLKRERKSERACVVVYGMDGASMSGLGVP